MSPIITLTTDFGLSGPYVAAMKGVILGINPAARVLDVSHEIGPQNIREAALCLMQVVPYFPAGTIHVVVVDPGVGTSRPLLCMQMHEQVFLAPDNGVLSWAGRHAPAIQCTQLSETRFWLSSVSATFHGRDILAPVAAHLSSGLAINQLGPAANDWVDLPWPEPIRGPHEVAGEVLTIDRFGNLITNITAPAARGLMHRLARVLCNGQDIGTIRRTYADAQPGELLGLIGSSGLLEIAVRNGNAAQKLGAAAGAAVQVVW
jgi:hypothetical protein